MVEMPNNKPTKESKMNTRPTWKEERQANVDSYNRTDRIARANGNKFPTYHERKTESIGGQIFEFAMIVFFLSPIWSSFLFLIYLGVK